VHPDPTRPRHETIATVLLFKTAEGRARLAGVQDERRGDRQRGPRAKPKRFTVRGVPGARGWTGRDRHDNPIGHVYWVQGRCEMVLGNEGEGDFVKPLSIGAKAIYDRTKRSVLGMTGRMETHRPVRPSSSRSSRSGACRLRNPDGLAPDPRRRSRHPWPSGGRSRSRSRRSPPHGWSGLESPGLSDT
jgi:hypothetical protein